LLSKIKKNEFNDPLEWWKLHEPKFPLLAELARIYLAVQATSAASERVFSAASRIITAKQNRVDSEMAGKQFFVSRNWGWFYDMMELAEQLETVNPPPPAPPATPAHTI
jgi:hypothetical protein